MYPKQIHTNPRQAAIPARWSVREWLFGLRWPHWRSEKKITPDHMVVEFLPSPLGRCLLFLLLWCEIALRTCKRDQKGFKACGLQNDSHWSLPQNLSFPSLPIPLQAIVKYFGLSHTQSHTDLWNPLAQSLYQCPVKGQKEFFTYRYKPNSTFQYISKLHSSRKWMKMNEN